MTTGLSGATRPKFLHEVYFGKHNSVICMVVERTGGYDVQFCDASDPTLNKRAHSFEAADYDGSLLAARDHARQYAKLLTK